MIGYSIACELWKISIDYYRKRCWNHTDYLNLFCITDLSGSKHFVESWLPLYLSKHYGSAAPTTGQGVIVFDTPMEYNTTDNSQLIPDSEREAVIYQITLKKSFWRRPLNFEAV